MPDKEDTRFRPPQRQASPVVLAVGAGALVAAALAGAWVWFKPAPTDAVQATAPAPSAAPSAPTAVPLPAGVQNPVGVLGPPDTALPPLAESDVMVTELLSEVLGAGQVSSLLQTESFARRVVATVDSLTQAHAPVQEEGVIQGGIRAFGNPLGGGIGKDVRVARCGGAVHVSRVTKEVRSPPKELDSRLAHQPLDIVANFVEALVRLGKRQRLGSDIPVVKTEILEPQLLHELESAVRRELRPLDRVRLVIPRTDSGSRAEHIASRRAYCVPP